MPAGEKRPEKEKNKLAPHKSRKRFSVMWVSRRGPISASRQLAGANRKRVRASRDRFVIVPAGEYIQREKEKYTAERRLCRYRVRDREENLLTPAWYVRACLLAGQGGGPGLAAGGSSLEELSRLEGKIAVERELSGKGEKQDEMDTQFYNDLP